MRDDLRKRTLLLRSFCACLAAGFWLTVLSKADAADRPGIEIGHVPVGGMTKAWLPNLAKLADGSILCVYTYGDAPRLSSIQVVRTVDAGKTWSKPLTVMEIGPPGLLADPNILVVGDRITVFATHLPDAKPPFAYGEYWASTSNDLGNTWNSPTHVPRFHTYMTGKVHVPIKLRDGTILMGYSWDTNAERGSPSHNEPEMVIKAGVLRSSNGGRTWKPGADVYVNGPMGADEPAIVELKDGSVFMIVRSGGPRPFEVISRDGGKTWSKPRESEFEGHNTPSALLRLKDGAILRVWDLSTKNRYPLVAAVSTDECQTWSQPQIITEPKVGKGGKPAFRTACYPSAAQAEDGTILVVWWETGDFGSRLGYARFGRAWLTAR